MVDGHEQMRKKIKLEAYSFSKEVMFLIVLMKH